LIEFLTALASVGAALAAIAGIAFGLTRTARLRRREQLFREALTALDSDDPRRKIVHELHRAALADLIARQLTATWRSVWPWGAWAVITLLFGQAGYNAAAFYNSGAGFEFYEFSTKLTGDPITLVPFLFMMLVAAPQVFVSYLLTLEGRAEMARRFFDGSRVGKPPTLGHLMMQAEAERERLRGRPKELRQLRGPGAWAGTRAGVASWWRMSTPGFFAASIGLLAGQSIWTRQQSGDRMRIVQSLDAYPAISILAFALSATGVFFVWASAVRDLERLALPSQYPQIARLHLRGNASGSGSSLPTRGDV
jgi:hypothetical protein